MFFTDPELKKINRMLIKQWIEQPLKLVMVSYVLDDGIGDLMNSLAISRVAKEINSNFSITFILVCYDYKQKELMEIVETQKEIIEKFIVVSRDENDKLEYDINRIRDVCAQSHQAVISGCVALELDILADNPIIKYSLRIGNLGEEFIHNVQHLDFLHYHLGLGTLGDKQSCGLTSQQLKFDKQLLVEHYQANKGLLSILFNIEGEQQLIENIKTFKNQKRLFMAYVQDQVSLFLFISACLQSIRKNDGSLKYDPYFIFGGTKLAKNFIANTKVLIEFFNDACPHATTQVYLNNKLELRIPNKTEPGKSVHILFSRIEKQQDYQNMIAFADVNGASGDSSAQMIMGAKGMPVLLHHSSFSGFCIKFEKQFPVLSKPNKIEVYWLPTQKDVNAITIEAARIFFCLKNKVMPDGISWKERRKTLLQKNLLSKQLPSMLFAAKKALDVLKIRDTPEDPKGNEERVHAVLFKP